MSDDAARIFEDWHRPTNLAGEGHRTIKTYVGLERPPLAVECAARTAMLAAAIDLAVKRRPRLLFFESVAHGPELEALGVLTFKHPAVLGLAHLGHHAIAVAADLSAEDAAEVAAHETFHLATGRHGSEADALRYGLKIRTALDPVMAFVKERFEPRMHELDYPPGRDRVLAGVAAPADLLRAPGMRGALPRAYVNVGSRWSPCWQRVS